MRHYRSIAFLAAAALLVFLVRCSSGTDDKKEALAIAANWYENVAPVSDEYTAACSGYESFFVDVPAQDEGTNVSFQYTLDLGACNKDVYFTFTNINASSSSWYPGLDSANESTAQAAAADTAGARRSAIEDESDSALRGKPEISEFNRNPYGVLNRINPVNMLLNSIEVPEPGYDVETSSKKPFQIDAFTDVDATCRKVVTDGTKTLNIWVADSEWNNTSTYKFEKVDQDMVDYLAEAFLKNGTDNDIYDWVTSIYGEEWTDDTMVNTVTSLSETEEKMLIDGDNQITILLFDIDDDSGKLVDSRVVGYFWAKDNFKDSVISYSNERIMFYMDAPLFATVKAGESFWSLSGYWPSTCISILSHEFQHMIHFYQKAVLKAGGYNSDTWLDEMCAMAAEDLVANKVGVDGPRGVDFDDPSAGGGSNTEGRLPRYNLYNDTSVTDWGSESTLVSYAVNYALGAYLARNYGGAEFFRGIVQNPYTDKAAVKYAIQQIAGHDPDETFGRLLQKWAVANLLSDRTDTKLADECKYNDPNPNFGTFTSTVDTKEYGLGAINLYNYTFGTQTGPYIHTDLPGGFMPPASNIYYQAADNLTGTRSWTIRLKSKVRMSVVVK